MTRAKHSATVQFLPPPPDVPRQRRWLAVLVAFALAGTALVLVARHVAAEPAPPSGSTLELLDQVRTVADRPNPPGYDRSCARGHGCVFGPSWTDDTNVAGGHNGCDTRNDVLGAQLIQTVSAARTHWCVVLAGTLYDPYTGQKVKFTKYDDPGAVQIDHVYPLALAWDMGANTWPIERRVEFANDQVYNLLATARAVNQAKSDKGPGEWIEHVEKSRRCAYAYKILAVAVKYDLPITSADHVTIRRTAQECPSTP